MRRGLALGLLLGWLLGVATGLLGVAVTGGWYEYRTLSSVRPMGAEAAFREGWQPAPEGTAWLRRPRFRLP